MTSSAARTHRFAFPALILANVALAFGPWLVRLADVGPVATGMWRMTLALPVLWLIARATGDRPHWPARAIALIVLIAAIFYALDLAAWNAGIRLSKLGNASLFGNSGSFVFAIYGLWLAHRRPSATQALALFMAAAGAALLISGSYQMSTRNFTGDLLTLAAGLLYGGYLIFVEKARGAMRPMALLILASLFAIPILGGISLGLGERMWPDDWTPLLLFALSSQVLGQGILVYAIGTLPPLVIGLALLTQPAISALIGWLVYGEKLSATDGIGALAIAAALVLVRLPERGLRNAERQPS